MWKLTGGWAQELQTSASDAIGAKQKAPTWFRFPDLELDVLAWQCSESNQISNTTL